MRIVIRIGGSVVASPINTDLMSQYADIIKAVKQQGHEVVRGFGRRSFGTRIHRNRQKLEPWI